MIGLGLPGGSVQFNGQPMPTLIAINDPEDPRLTPYRQVRDRDLTGRGSTFMAEGEVVLRGLVRSPLCEAVSVLLCDKRVEAMGHLLASLDAETPVYMASQAVMDTVVGFPIHRGILAVGRRIEIPSVESLLDRLPVKATLVVLSAIANHDNMGGLFRNAAAFGADAVLLDSDCCDPLYRKAIRVSVGAVLEVPYATCEPGQNVPDLLKAAGFRILSLSPAGVSDLSKVCRSARMAVAFGAEGAGLSSAFLAASETVRIPMAGRFDSLNVATSSGIVLHHLAAQDRR